MDYKEAIAEIHDELCYEFQEQHGREPNSKEYMDLYDQAQERYQNKMAEYGDYLRKREMGE
jgi:hypothetical protein